METSSRIINCNSDAALPNEKFCSNVIRTSKYTLLSFLPINLYEQFKRVTNLFFLGLGILQFFPIFQTIDPVVAILPLIIVLGGSMLKEGYEDSKRHRLDSQVNNRPIKMVQSKIKSVLIKSGNILSHNEAAPLFRQKPKITPMAADHCETIKWKDVQVGDVVIVYENEPFPADMVLIGTSDPEGICFVETKNLDGETNLKVHRAPDEFQGKLSVTELEKFSKFGAKIECGPPHAHLSSFSGVMTVEQCSLFPQAKIPLHIENILLRGCFLRNTNWIMGIVVFTGDETKIRLNSGATPLKRSLLEIQMNYYV